VALPDELLELSFDDELSLFLGGGSGWPRVCLTLFGFGIACAHEVVYDGP